MKPIDWTPILEILKSHQRFLITTHVEPDGDGIGSEIALYRYLLGQGKEVVICNTGHPSRRFEFLTQQIPIEWMDSPKAKKRLLWAEVLLVLDTCDVTRLGSIGKEVDNFQGPIVAIDHHLFDHGLDAITIRVPEASSTGELIYDLLRALEHPIDAHTATALFTSLVTDTGWLRFEKTSPQVLRIAADLVEIGVQPYELFSLIHDVKSWNDLSEHIQILHTAHPVLNEQVAIAVIEESRYRKYRPDSEAAEEILNTMLALQPVEVAILLTETQPEEHRISFRSRGRIDVGSVAVSMGGGGHHNSSGAFLRGSATEIEATLIEKLSSLFPAS
ncbi:MAG: DHH family phosphoesterase [Planctomycetota bacterium]|jgi:phosphoesterase RecJ-like protein|nr:DHH family phosphoesterase [Planctomycetota bacterium]